MKEEKDNLRYGRHEICRYLVLWGEKRRKMSKKPSQSQTSELMLELLNRTIGVIFPQLKRLITPRDALGFTLFAAVGLGLGLVCLPPGTSPFITAGLAGAVGAVILKLWRLSWRQAYVPKFRAINGDI